MTPLFSDNIAASMFSKTRKSRWKRWALAAALSAFALFALGRLSLSFIGWWIDFSQPPEKSDIIVSLAGDFSRSPYAAELFAQGYAPQVWISRPRRPEIEAEMERLGVDLRAEDIVNYQILLRKGVPKDRIRLYGHDVRSTADEAVSLRREFDPRGKKILVVTSRFHARRASMIFRRFLPEASLRVTATSYEPVPDRWWTDKELASVSLLEMFKTAYFLGGGRFFSPAAKGPAAPL